MKSSESETIYSPISPKVYFEEIIPFIVLIISSRPCGIGSHADAFNTFHCTLWTLPSSITYNLCS